MHRLATMAGLALALIAPAGARAADIGVNVPGGAAAVGQLAQVPRGTGSVRVFVIYPGGSQPSAQVIADYEVIVNALAASGVKPVLTVVGPEGAGPPADAGAYATYIGALAKAYGAKVGAWEIWNEPDDAAWWGAAGGDPVAYAALLKASYPLVHPHAPVFVGGLTGNNYGFLEQVYEALGGSSAGAFDGVATHTDTACSIVGPDSYYRDGAAGPVSRWSFLGLRSVHDVMAAHGDDAKPIWITELGWTTEPGTCLSGMWAGQKNAGVSEADQARFLGMAWHCLKDYPYVTNALWFNLRDQGGSFYGLQSASGAAKPALQAYLDVVAGKDDYAGQLCGDFGGPTISVASPASGFVSTVGRPLALRVAAADPQGVGRITLLVDGAKLRNFTNPGVKDPALWPKTMNGALSWMGAKRLAPGPHTLTVVAVDGSQNQATTSVSFRATKPKAKPKAKKRKRSVHRR